MEVKDKPKSLTPPKKQLKSIQYDLFSSFLTGKDDKDNYSNTVELWDRMPKYFMSRQKQDKLRNADDGLPAVLEREFRHNGRDCWIAIQPAQIKIKGEEGYKGFYPSANEELVEDVLRKLFIDQKLGNHDVEKGHSWVKFSLQMIRKELKERGKTRSIDQVKQSIEILANSIIRLYIGKTCLYTNAILSDLTSVNRDRYLNDPSSYWVARLPELVSHGINNLGYRQLNYDSMMRLKSQISRQIVKVITHHFINASLLQPYDLCLLSFMRDTGLPTNEAMRDNVKAAKKAIQELIENERLTHYKEEITYDRSRKIESVHFKLYPHPQFIKEQKAANKRNKLAQETVAEHKG